MVCCYASAYGTGMSFSQGTTSQALHGHATATIGTPLLQAQHVVMDYYAESAIPQSRPQQQQQPSPSPFADQIALRDVNVSIQAGESVAIMGPSGSGKSTLLHCLAGILKPTSGQVFYQGTALSSRSDTERTKLRRNDFGFVFQSGQLLPELSALANVALPLMLNGQSFGEATAIAAKWLNACGLAGLFDRRPGELSGGQSQRVALARALVIQPSIVFADEPTGALDQQTGHMVMDMLTDATRQNHCALVVVTHDIHVAQYCSRILTMQDGQIIEEQTL